MFSPSGIFSFRGGRSEQEDRTMAITRISAVNIVLFFISFPPFYLYSTPKGRVCQEEKTSAKAEVFPIFIGN
jgi:hypothetical protein